MRVLASVLLVGCSYHPPASVSDDTGDAPTVDALPSPTSPRLLTIDNTAATVDLPGFPLFVALDGSRVDYAVIADPTRDLRFHDMASDSDLDYEIDYWDPAGESGVWISMPVMHAHATEHVTMSFGAGVGGTYRPTNVWAAYELVHHLEPTLDNSASPAFPGTLASATIGPGTIGSAASFDGSADQRVTFGNDGALFSGWGAFTLEFWIRPDYTDGSALGGEPRFMDRGGALDLPRLFDNNGALVLQIDFNWAANGDITVNTEVAPNAWTYIAYTFLGSNNMLLYKNGELASQSFNLGSDQLETGTSTFSLGSNGPVIAGAIDEVRIMQTGRNASWLRAQYLAMTRQSITFTPP